MITLDDALSLPINELMNLAPSDLKKLQDKSNEQLKKSKEIKEWIDGAIMMKYDEIIKQVRQRENKLTGSIKFDDSGVQITSEFPKRVSWDQKELSKIADNISSNGGNPDEYMDISYKIEERKYNAWPEKLKNIFVKARTLKIGKPTITLNIEKGNNL